MHAPVTPLRIPLPDVHMCGGCQCTILADSGEGRVRSHALSNSPHMGSDVSKFYEWAIPTSHLSEV